MSLPIINACFGYSRKDSSIKEEISADKFVVKMGYKNELKSALDKITKSTKYKKINKKPPSLDLRPDWELQFRQILLFGE